MQVESVLNRRANFFFSTHLLNEKIKYMPFFLFPIPSEIPQAERKESNDIFKRRENGKEIVMQNEIKGIF